MPVHLDGAIDRLWLIEVTGLEPPLHLRSVSARPVPAGAPRTREGSDQSPALEHGACAHVGAGSRSAFNSCGATRVGADCGAGGNAPGTGKTGSATRSLPIIVVAMTDTTLAETVPTAAPLSGFQSWLETAIAILQASSTPLTALQIVVIARSNGCSPTSRTRTPAQSVNRDLRAAVRRGDPRVALGPGAGQFCGTVPIGPPSTPAATSRQPSSRALRLPIGPLTTLIAAQGGLRACGVRHQPGDTIERVRWAARLQRAYLRARRRGWISLFTADELAVEALRMHPSAVWGMKWWDVG